MTSAPNSEQGSSTAPDVPDAATFAAALLALRAGYVPEWRDRDLGAEVAMVQIAARYLEAVARRVDQAPAKNQLAFLELAGTRLIAAQPARAPVVFRLAENAPDVRDMLAGTRVAAAPPPGSSEQISYETERSTGLAAARLEDVVSLWPGRDQYADHSTDLREGQPFRPFELRALKDTPHHLYIAHDTLLALAGSSGVTVTFDLTTVSSQYLDLRWEYWDGDVWRPFKDMSPACSNAEADQLDSTSGFRSSGAYRLEADCAETEMTTVDGHKAFWVRGRLEETLPADPGGVLPEVESVQLQTEITRSYSTVWRAADKPAPAGVAGSATALGVSVTDAAGVGLEGVKVRVLENGSDDDTKADGRAQLTLEADQANTVVVIVGEFEQQHVVEATEVARELTFALDMSAFDAASVDGAEVDLSEPFFPFGVQPQPGAALYLSHQEAFAKPGANLRFYVQPATTPQDEIEPQLTKVPGQPPTGPDKPMEHTVSWEYWNGRAWASLHSKTLADQAEPDDLRGRGFVELTVPDDMTPTTVAEQEALWMRVRLVSGSFGFMRTVTVQGATPPGVTFFVPQPPALADLRIGYAWQNGPIAPERVVTYNDFRYEDRTEQALWPGDPFQPFVPVADPTPGLYLGFDRPLPVDNLGLFFDIVEDPGEAVGPTLVWESWGGVNWERLSVSDETRNLRVPGIVTFIGPEDMPPLARFGTDRHWVRARLNEDGPPGEPTIDALLANAVWVVQRQTVTDEPLGTATGQPGQVFPFRQVPVLPGQEIEVRELAGRRANVEWRILAAELFGRGGGVIDELEDLLAAEGTADVWRSPLRLRRNRLKQVTEAWVRWEERWTLWSSGPRDRHYAMDRARGRLLVGDGEHGRVPPLGADVIARRYQTGGGREGNVAANGIIQILGPVGGVESVSNPAPAEGGADAETAEQVACRGPSSVRHRGRAVTAPDYETLAREASRSVAVARAIPGSDADGRAMPGRVTLVIIPQSAEPRPFPSFGLRDQVRRFIEERAPADLVEAAHLVVTGPRYQPVDVAATLVVADPSKAGAVERAAHDAIANFLHPLRGGPDRRGWQPGQVVSVSDLASRVEQIDELDHARELGVLLGGVVHGEILQIAADRMPAAGAIRLRVTGA